MSCKTEHHYQILDPMETENTTHNLTITWISCFQTIGWVSVQLSYKKSQSFGTGPAFQYTRHTLALARDQFYSPDKGNKVHGLKTLLKFLTCNSLYKATVKANSRRPTATLIRNMAFLVSTIFSQDDRPWHCESLSSISRNSWKTLLQG
jgi:hypothetical protein